MDPAEASAAAEADMKREAEVAKKAKDEKKPKKTESAGISKAERDELESLKQQIIKKKEKKLSAESEAEKKKLEEEIEEYRMKLQTEFKYTKKEIAADPDMQDMLARMKAFK